MSAPGATAEPFGRRIGSTPVTIARSAEALERLGEAAGAVVVRPEAPLHDHGEGVACVACESRGDPRVLLFELDEKRRRGLVAPFTQVVIDATGLADADSIRAALVPGARPALGLRDHIVARSFHLVDGS